MLWLYSQGGAEVLGQEAAVAQQSGPELHAHDAEDEEDKEAEQEHVAQHGESVQQQRHQDTHACRGGDMVTLQHYMDTHLHTHTHARTPLTA